MIHFLICWIWLSGTSRRYIIGSRCYGFKWIHLHLTGQRLVYLQSDIGWCGWGHTRWIVIKYCSIHRLSYISKRVSCHDDVIKWKHFLCYWPFVRGIHRPPVNSPHKGQWRGVLMFSLIYARNNSWANNGDTGDLRRHRAYCDVIVMCFHQCHFFIRFTIAVTDIIGNKESRPLSTLCVWGGCTVILCHSLIIDPGKLRFVSIIVHYCFCPWTFSLNIGLNMFPLDTFMSCLHSLLGYSIGEFQALQLIVLAAFGAVD